MLKEQPSHCPAVTPGGSVLFQEFDREAQRFSSVAILPTVDRFGRLS